MKRLVLAVFLGCACVLAAPGRADEPEPDPRLDQKVTVAAVAQPLTDVVAGLSSETGVSLDVHRNLKNQKVTVLLDGQPLYVVMNQLRDLLDALWFTKKVGDETGYYLKQKHGWQEYAARLAAQQQAKKERRETEFRSRVLDAARIASLPREELLAMLDTNPRLVRDILVGYSWVLEGLITQAPPAPAVLSGLSDVQWDLVIGGKPLQIPYNDLPPAGCAVIDKVCEWMEANPSHRLSGVLSGVDPGLLYLGLQREKPGTAAQGATSQGHISLWLWSPAEPRVSLELAADVGEPLPLVFGTLGWLRSLAPALGLTGAQLRQRLEATEAGRALLAPPEPAAPPTEESGYRHWETLYEGLKDDELLDLELTKDLGLRRGESGSVPFECMLEGAHRKGGMALVADSYVTLKGEGCDVVPKDPDLMATVVAEAFGRAWTRDGTVYRFRSKTWYENDAVEPPVWLIKRLQGRVSRQKGQSVCAFEFDLDDLVTTYQTLSDEQIEALHRGSYSINRYYDGILRATMRSRVAGWVLRFHGSLNAVQRQKLRGDGIGVGDLSPAQQAAFADCLVRAFKKELPPPQIAAASMRLAIEVRDYERESAKWLSRRAVFIFALAGGKEEKASVLLAAFPRDTEAKESGQPHRGD